MGNYPEFILRGSFTLLPSDEVSLKRLFELAQSPEIGSWPYLVLALRRFNQSYDRIHAEDRLIDHMISLEALYLNDVNEKAEMSFRLALRVAFFLRKEKRHELYRKLRSAYDLRSRIVHGEHYQIAKIVGKDILLEDFVGEIEECLRESLVKFLDLVKTGRSKLVSWEDIVFE